MFGMFVTNFTGPSFYLYIPSPGTYLFTYITIISIISLSTVASLSVIQSPYTTNVSLGYIFDIQAQIMVSNNWITIVINNIILLDTWC